MADDTDGINITFQHGRRKLIINSIVSALESMSLRDGLHSLNIDSQRVRLIFGGKTLSDYSARLSSFKPVRGRGISFMLLPEVGYVIPEDGCAESSDDPVCPAVTAKRQAERDVSLVIGIESEGHESEVIVRDRYRRISVHAYGPERTVADLAHALSQFLHHRKFELINKGRLYSVADPAPLSSLPSREFMLRRTAEFWDREDMRIAMDSDLRRLIELVELVPRLRKASQLDTHSGTLKLREARNEVDRIRFNADLFSDRVDSDLAATHQRILALLHSLNSQT